MEAENLLVNEIKKTPQWGYSDTGIVAGSLFATEIEANFSAFSHIYDDFRNRKQSHLGLQAACVCALVYPIDLMNDFH
jgi:hypothetical protein